MTRPENHWKTQTCRPESSRIILKLAFISSDFHNKVHSFFRTNEIFLRANVMYQYLKVLKQPIIPPPFTGPNPNSLAFALPALRHLF